jgi:two-component system chemotaxis response regulator CheY
VVDVIVTDLNMPRMNGLTLIRHIRAMPTHHGIPIVVLTTESEDFAAKEAKAAGATAWITKPFTAEKLLGVVLGLVR